MSRVRIPLPALVGMVGGGVVVNVLRATVPGAKSGGLLGRRPRTLQLNQPDWRPALRAVHSNTSVAVCFAARVRTVLWRTLDAISSSSWTAYALKLLCRKGCVGGKILQHAEWHRDTKRQPVVDRVDRGSRSTAAGGHRVPRSLDRARPCIKPQII